MSDYKIRFIPLGGIVGVTKNMYVYELYVKSEISQVKSAMSIKDNISNLIFETKKNKAQANPMKLENKDGYVLQDILIVDCGIGFPQEKEFGVDFVIPDISYLKDKTQYIRAILLSHGHEDHISALPYHYVALGKPPIYTSNLTASFIENKAKEFKLNLQVERVTYQKEYAFGGFKVKFINLTHSIPDTTHILIGTPLGTIYHGPDFKLDLTPPYGKSPDFYSMVKAGHDGVLCLLSDCLGAERDGLTLSEATIGQTFEDEMRKTRGKFIMTTFSSNISRIRQCVEAAIKFNRKVIFFGRSMKENTRIAQSISYLPIPPSLLGSEQEAMKLPPNKVCLIVAGSQGQYGSALSKIASRQHDYVKIKKGDKVIISSDPIPGNENEVYALIEDLSMQGAEVAYTDIQDQLHASGHGNREDLKFLIRFTNPKYFIPIGGTIRHQQQYKKLVSQLGYAEDSVMLLKEGETIEFTKNGILRGTDIETKNVYVDAYGVGDVGNIILRDRKTLSTDGVVVAVIMVDERMQLIKRPYLLSRGFVFEKAENDLFDFAKHMIEKKWKPYTEKITEVNVIKRSTINILEQLFKEKTGRKPLVIVEVIQS